MLYAHVVLGLPVEGPFDYSVPGVEGNAVPGVKGTAGTSSCSGTGLCPVPGCRVWVNFRGKKELGYCVSTARRTRLKVVKPLLGLIDETPLFSANMLELCRQLSAYYCCSWGEMLDAGLPEPLRKGRKLGPLIPQESALDITAGENPLIIHAADKQARFAKYFELIRRCLSENRNCMVLFPDLSSLGSASPEILAAFPGISAACLLRNQPDELEQWETARQGRTRIVLGTRSAVFAPVRSLGLIIIDEENSGSYKQDQVPHYHCRTAAFLRSRLEGCRLALGSQAPSLEAMYMARQGKAGYLFIPDASFPEVKIIDTRRLPYGSKGKLYLSKFLQDAVLKSVSTGQKTLVFLNRRGFATTASCPTCGKTLTCPRCSINLVYYFHNQSLACNYCNFRMKPPRLCPECNAGYIKYTGGGTEKVESELARIFPQARIRLLEEKGACGSALDNAGIFIATQSVLGSQGASFYLTCCLSIDNTLNHVDFRSAEKAYFLLTALRSITTGMMVVQTRMPEHYVLGALSPDGHESYYRKELALRKQLQFPPVRHFCLVKCRGRSEEKVRASAEELFADLSLSAPGTVRVISVNAASPLKLRGNFHWNILLSAAKPETASAFLKKNLKNFRRSGIIVTVDIDPA